MKTRLDEIASGIYRVSVYIPEADFMFNQFLVNGDEPLLFHTGPRRLSRSFHRQSIRYGRSRNCAG
jgi:hypothetical protein